MYTRIHWYKFENNKGERILSCKCTVLHCIFDYSYIVQIAKRRTSPVFGFNMQMPDQVECLIVFCLLKANTGRASLLFAQFSSIPICNTKQYIYKTNYARLTHSRTYSSVYIGIGSTCMHKGH